MNPNVLFPDWREKVVYGENGPKHQVMKETEKIKVLVGGAARGSAHTRSSRG